MLLGSLPPSYSTLVTALEARDVISPSYVQQSLIREEQRLKGMRHYKQVWRQCRVEQDRH